jgi:hypothetical protein
MREPTTVYNPRVGDTLKCPGCGDMLRLTPMDGWCGPHVSCVDRTVHTDWIVTVLNPPRDNPT